MTLRQRQTGTILNQGSCLQVTGTNQHRSRQKEKLLRSWGRGRAAQSPRGELDLRGRGAASLAAVVTPPSVHMQVSRGSARLAQLGHMLMSRPRAGGASPLKVHGRQVGRPLREGVGARLEGPSAPLDPPGVRCPRGGVGRCDRKENRSETPRGPGGASRLRPRAGHGGGLPGPERTRRTHTLGTRVPSFRKSTRNPSHRQRLRVYVYQLQAQQQMSQTVRGGNPNS